MEQTLKTSADLVFVTVDEDRNGDFKRVLVYAATYAGKVWKQENLHNHAWYVESICNGRDFVLSGEEIALELYEKLCHDSKLKVAWLS